MNYDDATVPMPQPDDHPTWPVAGPSRPPRLAPVSPTARRSGCWLWLGVTGAFVAGLIVSAVIVGAALAPKAFSSTSASQTGGVLKVTITDTYLDKALNASEAGSLAQIQAHITTNGELTISGVLQGTGAGAGQTAVVVLAPAVSQGAVIVQAISGSVGGFPLPGDALDSIASAANQQLTPGSSVSLGGGQRLTAQSVSFADGQMTIAYA
jgi:hypothetical protein